MAVLYVIATPIGNIDDITIRAKEVLKSIDIVLCEDTRVTGKLFDLLGIDRHGKKFLSYHDHNERDKLPSVIEILQVHDVALISDAGTPLLSDPGFPLIREIRQNHNSKIKIEVLPGATSITTALVASGFPTDKFLFMGYVPRKDGERKKFFESMKLSFNQIKSTFILFETKHRLVKTLEFIRELLGSSVEIALCHELTKIHESVEVGTAEELLAKISDDKNLLKGELVLVVRFV